MPLCSDSSSPPPTDKRPRKPAWKGCLLFLLLSNCHDIPSRSYKGASFFQSYTQMRSYDGNKSDGERRLLSNPACISRSHSFLLIGLLYWLSISIHSLPAPDRTRTDQIRMPAEASAWNSVAEVHNALTPDTYPLPSDQERCGNNYLKLNFVCDPDILLSHTEAIIINSTHAADPRMDNGHDPNDPAASLITDELGAAQEDTRRNNVRDYLGNGPAGHRHSHKCIQSRFYTVGIALAKTMQEDGLGQCNGNGGTETRYSLDQQRALKVVLEKTKVLPRMAKKLRERNWEAKSGCQTDILILVVQSVVFCHEGSKAVFSGVEPLMGLSFSPRVQNLLAEATASNLEQSRRRWKTDSTYTDSQSNGKAVKKHKFPVPAATSCQNKNCVINMIKRMMQLLNDGLPDLTGSDHSDRKQEDEHEAKSVEQDENGNTRPTDKAKVPEEGVYSYPKHSIPAWALIAFAISLSVALGCAYLGHWVNTGRSRLHTSSYASSAAKYHSHSRRWRAGFGGGMLELHNNAQPKGGGGQGSGFGQAARGRAGLPTGTVRAKMFGGLGMGPASARMRQANGPQHSYHRV